MHPTLRKSLLLLTLCAASAGAMAHTGHGTTSLQAGLLHPLGLDHLLAMVAVGIWSVSALPARKAWWGPATFLLALVASAALGASDASVPLLEHAIALSVTLFGLMLVVAAKPMPVPVGLGLVAAAASLHGLAHGAEAPAAGFAGYAMGFLLTTAALHLSGVGVGLALRRVWAQHKHAALGGLGAVFAGAGVYLLSQV